MSSGRGINSCFQALKPSYSGLLKRFLFKEAVMPNYTKYAALRDSHGVSDAQVAKAIGISSSTLYDWAHGRYTPKLDKISALAGYFGVALEELLGD